MSRSNPRLAACTANTVDMYKGNDLPAILSLIPLFLGSFYNLYKFHFTPWHLCICLFSNILFNYIDYDISSQIEL